MRLVQRYNYAPSKTKQEFSQHITCEFHLRLLPTCGTEEETKDGHHSHVAVGRGKGQVEHDEGDASVLDGGLKTYGNYLKL